MGTPLTMEDSARKPGSGEEALALIVGKEPQLRAHPGAVGQHTAGGGFLQTVCPGPQNTRHMVYAGVCAHGKAQVSRESVCLVFCTQAGWGAGVGGQPPPTSTQGTPAQAQGEIMALPSHFMP